MSAVLSKWMAFALVQLLWLSYNAHQPLRIDLVAFAALKVSYKHWNPSQSIVDLTVWRPTPSQLWSSTTEVGNSARGSGSLTLLGGLNTVIIPNSISIPISRGNIALVFFNSVDCVSSSSTPPLSSTELTVRRRQTDEYTSEVSLPSSRAR